VRWQVFGLVGTSPGTRTGTARPLVAVASQTALSGCIQCFVTAVVPTHRCGAVPESHRVPSCLGPRGRDPNQLRDQHM